MLDPATKLLIVRLATGFLLIFGVWVVIDFICLMKDKQDRQYNQRQRDEAYRKMREQYGNRN